MRYDVQIVKLLSLVMVLLLAACANPGPQRGASTRVSIGEVVGARRVDLETNTGRNALLGGAAGWALARNQSSSRQALAAAAGAGLGAAASNANARQGMQYTVRTADGNSLTIVTDQTQIRIGDCVSVEETQGTANIRRVSPGLCQPASPEVVQEVRPSLVAEADRCDDAKERLFAATTPEEVEVARQVMNIFCNE